MLGNEVCVLPHAVAGALDLTDDGVMERPVACVRDLRTDRLVDGQPPERYMAADAANADPQSPYSSCVSRCRRCGGCDRCNMTLENSVLDQMSV